MSSSSPLDFRSIHITNASSETCRVLRDGDLDFTHFITAIDKMVEQSPNKRFYIYGTAETFPNATPLLVIVIFVVESHHFPTCTVFNEQTGNVLPFSEVRYRWAESSTKRDGSRGRVFYLDCAEDFSSHPLFIITPQDLNKNAWPAQERATKKLECDTFLQAANWERSNAIDFSKINVVTIRAVNQPTKVRL